MGEVKPVRVKKNESSELSVTFVDSGDVVLFFFVVVQDVTTDAVSRYSFFSRDHCLGVTVGLVDVGVGVNGS